MVILGALALSVLLYSQHEAPKLARELIEKLRSEKIEDREEATRKIKEFGRAAIPELEKLAHDKDPEVKQRVQYLLDYFDIQRRLPGNLDKAFPKLLDRLSSEGDSAWTDVFVKVQGWSPLYLRDHGLYQDSKPDWWIQRNRDLEFLAPRAMRGARTQEEFEILCRDVSVLGLRSAAPEVARALLSTTDQKKRFYAIDALGTLKAKECSKDLRVLLSDENPKIRSWVCHALAQMDATDSVAHLTPLLRDPDLDVRGEAAVALSALGSSEGVSTLLALATDNKRMSLSCLNRLRSPDQWRKLRERLCEREYRANDNGIDATLADLTGGKVEITDAAAEHQRQSTLRGLSMVPLAGRTVLETVESFGGQNGYGYILEPDRIVLMKQDETLAFWRKWWAEHEKGK